LKTDERQDNQRSNGLVGSKVCELERAPGRLDGSLDLAVAQIEFGTGDFDGSVNHLVRQFAQERTGSPPKISPRGGFGLALWQPLTKL
jgi:hypothetical protein